MDGAVALRELVVADAERWQQIHHLPEGPQEDSVLKGDPFDGRPGGVEVSGIRRRRARSKAATVPVRRQSRHARMAAAAG